MDCYGADKKVERMADFITEIFPIMTKGLC
jgi:hypothetical protein